MFFLYILILCAFLVEAPALACVYYRHITDDIAGVVGVTVVIATEMGVLYNTFFVDPLQCPQR